MAAIPQPWLEDALEQLDLRKHDRCLVVTCPTEAHVAAVSQVVGRTSMIVVVEPNRDLAELASRGKHENLEVLAYFPEGHERFGTFDALLACPLTTMDRTVDQWAELILHNLRPGGRFVVDLPGENLCDALRRAWSRVSGDPILLAPIQGPAEAELAAALRRKGLRNVEASMGTHLVALESPFHLADFLAELWPDRDLPHEELSRALIEQFQTTEQVDVVFRRTRVHGLR